MSDPNPPASAPAATPGRKKLVLILAIAAAGSLEYFGLINVIPGFGSNRPLNSQPFRPIHRN